MSRKIAFTGIFTAVAVIFLYMSTIMPMGKLTLYFLASLPIAITIVELGAGAGIAVYSTVCLLSLLVSGNILGIVPFMFFFGHYPIFKYYIEKGRKAAVELLLKLAIFNISGLLWYLLFESLFITVLPSVFTDNRILPVVAFVVMQAVFMIYDYIYSRLIFYYESRVRIFKGP